MLYAKRIHETVVALAAHVGVSSCLQQKTKLGAVCTLGLGIIGIHAHVQRNVMSDPECVPAEVGRPKSKTATSMGMRESAKYLAASPYIRNLAMLVIAYGMSINIVEVTWKGNLKRAFPDPNAYSAFMGNFSTATGSVTLVMMILGRFIFQKFGWTTAALVTPTVLALTGAFFFSLILFEGPFAPLLSFFGTTPLMAAVLIGAAQVIIVSLRVSCCVVLKGGGRYLSWICSSLEARFQLPMRQRRRCRFFLLDCIVREVGFCTFCSLQCFVCCVPLAVYRRR